MYLWFLQFWNSDLQIFGVLLSFSSIFIVMVLIFDSRIFWVYWPMIWWSRKKKVHCQPLGPGSAKTSDRESSQSVVKFVNDLFSLLNECDLGLMNCAKCLACTTKQTHTQHNSKVLNWVTDSQTTLRRCWMHFRIL